LQQWYGCNESIARNVIPIGSSGTSPTPKAFRVEIFPHRLSILMAQPTSGEPDPQQPAQVLRISIAAPVPELLLAIRKQLKIDEKAQLRIWRHEQDADSRWKPLKHSGGEVLDLTLDLSRLVVDDLSVFR
jgi:hypothetical protein